jgi:hypothetical protein
MEINKKRSLLPILISHHFRITMSHVNFCKQVVISRLHRLHCSRLARHGGTLTLPLDGDNLNHETS